MGKPTVSEIRCNSILNRSGIEGVDYAVNPYLGCGHGCKYCYARFMKRFHKGKEEWGDFVNVKINAHEVLRMEAPRKPYGLVLLSSVTDPYQPVEKRYKLTEELLGTLYREGFSVQILTKSDLVTRDIELLRKFDWCEVGFTITTLDESIREAFEPGSASISRRINALKQLQESGLNTYAFLGPLLPYISERSLEPLLDSLVDRVDRVIVDRLNLKAGNWASLREVLDEGFPEIKSSFKAALEAGSDYYNKLRRRVKRLCEERYIPVDILF
ncbi:MAG: radical SAM protein [Candidatus Bathyarchaeia archaeon]